MGSYTDRLAARLREGGNGRKRGRTARKVADAQKVAGLERLVACAVIYGTEISSFGCKSHGEVRERLGIPHPYGNHHRPDETAGFITSTGRFVDRREAVQIANASGQCHGRVGELLSSDIDW